MGASCLCFKQQSLNYSNKQENFLIDLMNTTNQQFLKSEKFENNNLDTSPEFHIKNNNYVYINNFCLNESTQSKKNMKKQKIIKSFSENKNNLHNLNKIKDDNLSNNENSIDNSTPTKAKNKQEKSILILGSEDSGKTSLMIRYFEKKFENFYIPSLNDEINTKLIFGKKNFVLTFCVSNNLNINNINSYDCIFVIYDITTPKSFLKAKEIIDSLIEKQINKTIFLIGNKIDLKSNFEEEKEKENLKNIFNNQINNIFFISVKNNIGISAMMTKFKEIFNYDENSYEE
jgi:GTPase SAR1 family protein